jgi:hypothetical protein
VREALPGERWAWTVGALAVALAPLLAFAGGVVSPEAMLYAVSAALCYALARAFRRGLTRRRAFAIGLVVAVGFLTKLNFIGLAPGAILGLVVLGFRGVRPNGGAGAPRRAFCAMSLGIVLALAPVCVYALANLIAGHRTFGIASSAAGEANHHSILGAIPYIWEFYLPRLPGMPHDFPGLLTTRALWFDHGVGLYGWLDTSFPTWVDNLASIPAGLIALLALAAALTRLPALRRRTGELTVYVAMSVGLMVLVAGDSYVSGESGWAQPRYLLPLLPFGAALLALAARRAGRRWGPAVGVAIVLAFMADDLFSQLLVAARFYYS